MNQIEQIKENHDFLIAYHCRHNWKKLLTGVLTGKDTHKLFIAFSQFVKKTSLKPCIITFEYGHDIYNTKKLCAELGIEDLVYWFPLSARKDIMAVLKNCDIVAGEFMRSNYSYGAAFEALSLGKPFLHYRNDALYIGKSLYPMLPAHTVEEIVHHFDNFEEASCGDPWHRLQCR